MNTSENPYEILGIEHGPTARESEIKKAYRRLALKKHPDKNPNNPNAAAEFALLQKSYDILCDKDARSALDEWLRIQSFKDRENAARGEKRRKLAEELERREKTSKRESDEHVAKRKLQEQIERLRQQAIDKEQAAYVKRRVQAMKIQQRDKNDDTMTFEISWKGDEQFSSEKLASLFSTFGVVDHVTLQSPRHCAFVVMKAYSSLDDVAKDPALRNAGIRIDRFPAGYEENRGSESVEQADRINVGNPQRHSRLFPAAKTNVAFELKRRQNKVSNFEAELIRKMKNVSET